MSEGGGEKERRSARVIIGVPMERTVLEPSFWSFIALAQQGYAFVRRPYDRIDVTRNRMAQHLLDTPEFSHLLMLDMDHAHPPDIVKRLARWWLKDPEKLVIAGLNFRRTEPYDPLVWFVGPDGQWYHAVDWPQGILKADIVGTGAMLIHRSVFERVPKPWFTNDYSKVEEGDLWPGEDVNFCKACAAAGIDIWVDTTTTSPHLGFSAVDESTHRAYMAAYPEMQTSEMDWVREKCGWLWGESGKMPDVQGRRVLYVGANTKRAYMAEELKEAGNTLDLLEIWPANCEHYRGKGLFQEIIQGDVRNVSTWRAIQLGPSLEGFRDEGAKKWDTAVWVHGPEHIRREELGAALMNLEAVADNVMVMTPYGYMAQDPFRGNPHEQHVSAWGPEEFRAMGYEAATRGRRDEAHAAVLAWKRRGGDTAAAES